MNHTIRLRGPWEFSVPGTRLAGRIEFPCTWPELTVAVGNQLPGAAIMLLRRFGKPTGLTAGDRVVLSLRHSGQQCAARLNGGPLTLAEDRNGLEIADVSDQLAERNELTVALTPPSPALIDAQVPVLEATLEIHAAT